MVAITGPSGSGKSTIINLIAAIDRPTAGTVTVAGSRLEEMTEQQLAAWRGRTIGIVFQFFQLMLTLTAAENAAAAGPGPDRHAGRAQAEGGEALNENIALGLARRQILGFAEAALRYLALDGTGPPQPQRTGQHDPPAHHLANNHADDERQRQIVTGQTMPDAALAAWSGCQSAGSGAPPDRAEQPRHGC